jgi:glycosyltransferase involved in cell wall biosynthesis
MRAATMKLLSIIIPVYNSGKTIGRTLESLNRISPESKEVTELVVIDDGSLDNSVETVTSKAAALSPISVQVVRQENQGTSSARNIGLKQCNGEWVFFLDADDELAFDPIPYIQEFSSCSSLGFATQYYKDLKPRTIKRPVEINTNNYLDVFSAENACTVSSVIFKKNTVQSHFDVNYLYLEDWLFWITNPQIFEKMTIFRNKIAAFIHAHHESKTADYVRHGTYRKMVADKIVEEYGHSITARQKNNFLIQAQIGLIQQGKKMFFKTFLFFPCNFILYMKLIIYFILKKKFARFDYYGK